MRQSTLGLPKRSVGPPAGGCFRQGWSMSGPQLQMSASMQCEPGRAVVVRRTEVALRGPGRAARTGAESSADGAGLLRVAPGVRRRVLPDADGARAAHEVGRTDDVLRERVDDADRYAARGDRQRRAVRRDHAAVAGRRAVARKSAAVLGVELAMRAGRAAGGLATEVAGVRTHGIRVGGGAGGVGGRRARLVRGERAARTDSTLDVGAGRPVAVPEIGHVAAPFDDAGIVAHALPPDVEIGVRMLDDARPRRALTETGEEPERRAALARTRGVGDPVALFVPLIQSVVAADPAWRILEVEEVAQRGRIGVVGEIEVDGDLAGGRGRSPLVGRDRRGTARRRRRDRCTRCDDGQGFALGRENPPRRADVARGAARRREAREPAPRQPGPRSSGSRGARCGIAAPPSSRSRRSARRSCRPDAGRRAAYP